MKESKPVDSSAPESSGNQRRAENRRFLDTYWIFSKMNDISKYFRSYCYRAVGDLGLSLNEIDVLVSLNSDPARNSVKAISENSHMTKGSISQAVESLRRKHLLDVQVNETDRRAVRIHLNESAMPIINRLRDASARFIGSISEGVTPREVATVSHVIGRVYDNKEVMKSEPVEPLPDEPTDPVKT